MNRSALLCLGALTILLGSAAGGWAAEPPRFSRHVVPLFSRLGCNAGACHGAVKGQNGFRLSLFGAEPALDHERLLRDAAGRRLDLLAPDQSLLLLKATGSAPHQGGRRMAVDSPEYRLLRAWIAAGAPLDAPEGAPVTRLAVTPARKTLPPGERYALTVEATFSDGSTEDVTALSVFESRDRGVAEVTADGQVRAAGVGDTALVVRYRSLPAAATVLVPAAATAFPDVQANNFIDRHVQDKLRRLNVPPSPLCDDVTFLRRASLDVTGALPTPDEVRAFLADPAPDKRAKKIDELLARPGHSALWATKFCDLLRPRISYRDFTHEPSPAAARRFYDWLRARLGENRPYDEIVERVLTATSLDGRSREEWIREVVALQEEEAAISRTRAPKAYTDRRTLDLYWHRFDAAGVPGTIQVAHAFLGLRLQCAQCHRHPTDVWTQDDLLSFANFFMRLRANTGTLTVKEAGEVKKKAGGQLSAEEKKKLTDEAARLAEESKKLAAAARQTNDKAEAKRLQDEASALQARGGALTRAVAVLDCSAVFHAPGNPFGFATVSSPLGTQTATTFRFPGEATPVTVRDDEDPRRLVVAWMRRPDNPYFARAIVNRVWAHHFDRGLIDPPDDLSPLNPPSNPELLDELCRGFIAHKYDLRWLHRTILTSQTYQTSGRATPENRADTRNFAWFYPRRLPAEVLIDAVDHATGGTETYSSPWVTPGSLAIEVPGSTMDRAIGNAFVEYAFVVFGRPTRNTESVCDCDRDTRPALVQSLFLANHPEVLKKIGDPKGRVAQVLKDQPDDARRVEAIYLWALCRPPTEAERRTCLEHLKKSPSPQKGLEGVMWGLLNSTEFVVNR
jgi:hypothetical protein